ncbi:MAG: ABC transporter permease, partial [Bacteroidota bacterium]
MIIRNLRVAWLHIRKQPLVHTLLIVGFALGMSVGLFALLIWNGRATMDTRINQETPLYRITSQVNRNYPFATSGIEVYDFLQNRGDVTTLFQLSPLGEVVITSKNQTDEFSEEGMVFRGPFFETFDPAWIQYEYTDLSQDPNVVFVSSRLAQKLFGTVNALNRPLESPTLGLLTVKGIFDAENNQYHVQPDFYVPWSLRQSLITQGTLPESNVTERVFRGAYTYLATTENPASFLPGLTEQMKPLYQNDEVISDATYHPQPLSDIVSDKLPLDTP